MEIPETIHIRKEEVDLTNSKMFRIASDRHSLNQKWKVALKVGVSLVEEIKIPFPPNRSFKNVKKLY